VVFECNQQTLLLELDEEEAEARGRVLISTSSSLSSGRCRCQEEPEDHLPRRSHTKAWSRERASETDSIPVRVQSNLHTFGGLDLVATVPELLSRLASFSRSVKAWSSRLAALAAFSTSSSCSTLANCASETC